MSKKWLLLLLIPIAIVLVIGIIFIVERSRVEFHETDNGTSISIIGGHYTMDEKQAADLICCMKPKAAIPTHYGEVVGNPTDGADFKDYVDIVDKDIQVELKL